MTEELTIALTKGRLADKTMELFERAGFSCEEMREDTRKLIFHNEEQGLNFFLSKGPDVPTYVERGRPTSASSARTSFWRSREGPTRFWTSALESAGCVSRDRRAPEISFSITR